MSYIASTRGDGKIDKAHSHRDLYFWRKSHKGCLTTISLTTPLDFELIARRASGARMSETFPYHTRAQNGWHSCTASRQHKLLGTCL